MADTAASPYRPFMRINAPQPFRLTFAGPDGPYTIDYRPTDEWKGVIEVAINGVAMLWDVAQVELESNGEQVLSGMTSGSEAIWHDQFWFELRPNGTPPLMRYWGDRVIWREDRS